MYGSPASALSMAHPDIGFDHALILGNRCIIAFGEHTATRQHGDAIAEVGDDLKTATAGAEKASQAVATAARKLLIVYNEFGRP